ncbi:hypothetical protein Hdeb2414_s0018g00531661 [Helianthus debilis subsp. tardiflorus]
MSSAVLLRVLFLELVVDSRSVYFRLKRIETLSQGFKCCLSVLGNFCLCNPRRFRAN